MSIARAALASALQRAFAEAGHPPSTEVAKSGIGVTEHQIHEWRSGTSLPATFQELEPLIAYLQVAAAATACATSARQDCQNVTGWPRAQWRRLWAAASTAAENQLNGD